MNMEERASKMMAEYSATAEHNVFISQELEKSYGDLVEKMEKNFSQNVGATYVNFTSMYMRLAKVVWSKFKKKYLPEQFNAFWNEHAKSDGRLLFQDEVQVHMVSSEFAGPKAAEFKSFPLGVTFRKAKTYVDNFGSGIVYWNGIVVDEKYVDEQLRAYFKARILKKFYDELKVEVEQNEFAEYDANTFVYLHEEKDIVNDMRIKALEFFGGITIDRIIDDYFKRFAAEEHLTLERYYKVKILIGLGDKLYDALS